MEKRSNLTVLLSQFAISGTLIKAERFGSGLINDTYLCDYSESSTNRKYILQRVNGAVFKNPEQVMQNVKTVTEHIVNKLAAQGVGDPYSVTPALIDTINNQHYLRDEHGDYWRVYHFIESGMVQDIVPNASYAREVGRGLGRFQSLVSDLSPDKLHDTLPGFHFTPLYLAEFEKVQISDAHNRATEIKSELAFVHERRSLAAALTDGITCGSIPLRVVHNDPKVNNVMIHKKTGKALCMLDLDTVKPGLVHFDFGDCVRSAANPAGEEAQDLTAVHIDLSLFEALTGGYLEETANFLTKEEIELLAASVKVITFELGLRFLTDHLRGDTYFRIKHPGHNLHRARVQFRLLESMERHEMEMEAIISKHIRA